MATIRKRGKTWTYQVYYKDENGEAAFKSKGGFSTKRDAQQAAQMIEMYHKGGLAKEDTPLIDYAQKWYHLYKEPHISARTQLTYQKSFMYMEQYFGRQPIKDVNSDTIQNFINQLGNGKGVFEGHPHARESVDKVRTHFSAVMKRAVRDGIFRFNPIEDTKVTYANAARPAKDKFLNEIDQRKLSQYILDHFNPAHFIYAFVFTALNTGMRPGELYGLTWDNVDLKAGMIHIVQAYDYTSTFDFIPPKGGHARDVSITPKVVELLRQLRIYQMANQHNPKNFVFLTYQNTVPTPTTTMRQFKALQGAAGIAEDNWINVHGLRHSHASLLLYQGVNIKSISERLGHQDVQTTMRIYAHVIDEMKARDTKLIQNILEKQFG